jgi:hypothetical protein
LLSAAYAFFTLKFVAMYIAEEISRAPKMRRFKLLLISDLLPVAIIIIEYMELINVYSLATIMPAR